MWEKITRVIKNWAYEEIEIEVEDGSKEKTTKKPIPSPTQTKVAYKYPRNIPLRFPLIQDDITEKNKQVNQVRNTNKNKVTNKRKSLSPTLSYKKKDEFAKIENIPAYLRKNKSRTKPTQTKVAYKYPRNIPLRFPLIQDDITEKNKQVNQVRNTNKNKVTNKRKSLSPTLSYKKKDEFAKIENIPAYLRKNKSRTMPTQ